MPLAEKSKIARHSVVAFAFAAATSCIAQLSSNDPRMAVIAPYSVKGEVRLLQVPAAGNFFSNKMMVMALRSGSTSDSVSMIVGALRARSPGTLAVFGDNESVNEATVLAALRVLAGSGPYPASTLVLVGRADEESELHGAAAAAGVQFELRALP